MRTHATQLSLSLALVATALAPSSAHSIAAPRPMHGAPYQVMLDPAHRPVLRGRKVTVNVTYNGCRPHAFALRTQRQTAGLYLWFVHTGGDGCAVTQVQRLQIELSAEQIRWGNVYLMTPNAGTVALGP